MEVNNTFSPIDIATSGLRAHSKQIEVISSNVANARTTDVGNGTPCHTAFNFWRKFI